MVSVILVPLEARNSISKGNSNREQKHSVHFKIAGKHDHMGVNSLYRSEP